MNWDPIISIARIAGVPLFIIGSAYVFMLGQVRGQMSKSARLELVDPAGHEDKFAAVSGNNEWAEANGFEWVGAYVYHAPFNPKTFISCWRRAVDGVVMACYVTGGQVIVDFVTVYQDDSGLTTCSAAAGMLYPPAPGVYKQAFPGAELGQVLERHLAADVFLRAKFGLRRPTKQEPLESLFVRSVAKTARRVWRIWFFPLRAFYWYSQMHKRVNVPVEGQAVLAPVP